MFGEAFRVFQRSLCRYTARAYNLSRFNWINCSPIHSLIPALSESLDIIGCQRISHVKPRWWRYHETLSVLTQPRKAMTTTGQNLKRQSLPHCDDFLLIYAARSTAAAFCTLKVLLQNPSAWDNYLMVPKISLVCCCHSIARSVLKASIWSRFIRSFSASPIRASNSTILQGHVSSHRYIYRRIPHLVIDIWSPSHRFDDVKCLGT